MIQLGDLNGLLAAETFKILSESGATFGKIIVQTHVSVFGRRAIKTKNRIV